MIRADLYEDGIRIAPYVSSSDYTACGCGSSEAFIRRLRTGRLDPKHCRMPRSRFLALQWAARPRELLPDVEVFQLPNPGPTGLFPINRPKKNALILVSGNSISTIEVLTGLFSTTLSPFWYLVADTQGHTVDMAMIYETLTAERICQTLADSGADQVASESALLVPGLASGIRKTLAEQTGRFISVGPVCAAEIPLFLGDGFWQAA